MSRGRCRFGLAASNPDEFLDIGKYVIAIVDTSLPALISRFPQQKNLKENLPAQALRTRFTVEPNSSQSQKANRSRKLRLPETMRETMARSASVPISVSIKSS